ncbi:MAG: DUF1893 domain-containing protein [Cellulosilyticaceae bacterium]
MTRQELKAYRDQHDYSCVVLQDGDVLLTSREKGITPLYGFLESLEVYPKGKLELADKIIGRAAAFLAIKLGVRYIDTRVLSETALEVLAKYNVQVVCDEIVPYIFNRNRDGQCPMESALADVLEVDEALEVIHDFRRRMQNKQKAIQD